MEKMKAEVEQIFKASPGKIILSKPVEKDCEYRKIVINRKKDGFQIEKFTQKQVFHENVSEMEALEFCSERIGTEYLQLNAWDQEYEHMILVSKKGKAAYKKKKLKDGCVAPLVSEEHNRKKKYILEEGTVIPPLVDMGIFTKEGRVVRSMYDKFKQINRFVEIIDDSIRSMKLERLNIIDFGCGKSYLTFILYYYLTEIVKIPVKMVGLDLKEDVIENCNAAAEKYGYGGLHFELGDIHGYRCDFPVDMVITLHACDTATDYALYNAVSWGAKMIFSVPCCQHELNKQMKAENLSVFTHYGIVKERVAALLTDSIRGEVLELCGYKTQLLEFIDLEHTPKNILIRAVKREEMVPVGKRKRLVRDIEKAKEEFGVEPMIWGLLGERIGGV
jgi:SAM-dependent methyltransferase